MEAGLPRWDAPPSFFLWMRATEAGDTGLVLGLPLSKDAWLAAKWLFTFPGFQKRYTALNFLMLKALLTRGGSD